jgi:predicted thioredoxin/glutaredoxin
LLGVEAVLRGLLHPDKIRPLLLLKEHVMKQVKVLDSGCRNCETTAKLVEEVATAKGVAVELEKGADMGAILGYGAMSTPDVVIDGKVVHAGGVPDRKKIEGWLA